MATVVRRPVFPTRRAEGGDHSIRERDESCLYAVDVSQIHRDLPCSGFRQHKTVSGVTAAANAARSTRSSGPEGSIGDLDALTWGLITQAVMVTG